MGGVPKDTVTMDRVKDLRSEAMLSQRELAERAKISQSVLSYMERNGRGRFKNAKKLAAALGAHVHDLSYEGLKTSRMPAVRVGSEYRGYVGRTTPERGVPERREDVQTLSPNGVYPNGVYPSAPQKTTPTTKSERGVHTRGVPDELIVTVRIEGLDRVLGLLEEMLTTPSADPKGDG